MPRSVPLTEQPKPLSASDLIAIGAITRTQGNRGAVRMMPFYEPVDRFDGLRGDELILELPPRVAEAFPLPTDSALAPEFRAFRVASHSYHQQCVILWLAEVPDMTTAEKLRGAGVWLRPAAIWELGDEEYFIHELKGYALVDAQTGAPLGMVADVQAGGAQDILMVDSPSGKRFPVPFARSIVVKVDPAGRRMHANLPPGLDEL